MPMFASTSTPLLLKDAVCFWKETHSTSAQRNSNRFLLQIRVLGTFRSLDTLYTSFMLLCINSITFIGFFLSMMDLINGH